MDTSLEIDLEDISTKVFLTTPASKTLGTPSPTSFYHVPGASTSFYPARISQAMVLSMGHMSHLANVRATQSEISVPWMNQTTMLHDPLQTSIDKFTMRVMTCERQHKEFFELTALILKVADMRKDVHYLRSADFTSIFQAVEIEVNQAISDTPTTKTKDTQMDDTIASGDRCCFYYYMVDPEDAMFETALQTSLREITMADSSTSCTANVTLGSDASTNGVTLQVGLLFTSLSVIFN